MGLCWSSSRWISIVPGYSLASKRKQTIVWANAVQQVWWQMASLGNSELMQFVRDSRFWLNFHSKYSIYSMPALISSTKSLQTNKPVVVWLKTKFLIGNLYPLKHWMKIRVSTVWIDHNLVVVNKMCIMLSGSTFYLLNITYDKFWDRLHATCICIFSDDRCTCTLCSLWLGLLINPLFTSRRVLGSKAWLNEKTTLGHVSFADYIPSPKAGQRKTCLNIKHVAL